ncbi:MAG TPA: molybdenum cofactor guanylyltransferase [Acidimicrobiales bacterium]
MSTRELGGLLLTGGASTRMGRDKAAIEIDGVKLAERTASLLSAVTTLALEVGPGVSTLPSVQEDPPGQGPLAAILVGHKSLVRRGLSPSAPCLVVSCDLPLLSVSVLRRLADAAGDRSVLPVIDGTAQPLCARWSARDLAASDTAFATGERSLRRLPERGTALLLEESLWGIDASKLRDADTPEDLASMGITLGAVPGPRPAEPDERPAPRGRR